MLSRHLRFPHMVRPEANMGPSFGSTGCWPWLLKQCCQCSPRGHGFYSTPSMRLSGDNKTESQSLHPLCLTRLSLTSLSTAVVPLDLALACLFDCGTLILWPLPPHYWDYRCLIDMVLGLKSGLCACKASTLTTELLPQPCPYSFTLSVAYIILLSHSTRHLK